MPASLPPTATRCTSGSFFPGAHDHPGTASLGLWRSRRYGIVPAGTKGDVDERDEDGHLDEGTDDSRQRLTRGDAEYTDAHGDRELEVVPRCGEGERRRPLVGEAESSAEGERAEPHDGEVAEERQRDPGDVGRTCGDRVTLEGEEDHDRVQQAVEGEGAETGKEPLLVPGSAPPALPHRSREEAGDERHPEEDGDRLGDRPDREVEPDGREPESRGAPEGRSSRGARRRRSGTAS